MGKGLAGVIALAAAVLASLSPAAAQTAGSVGILSEQAFQDRMVAAFERRYADAKVRRDGVEGLIVGRPGVEEAHLYLLRYYGIYAAEPERLEEITQSLVQLYAASIAPVMATPEGLILLIRPVSYDLSADDPARAALRRTWAGDLAVYVGLSRPPGHAIVPAAELRGQLKLDDAAIWVRAAANTRAHPSLRFEPQTVAPGAVNVVVTEAGLAASLLTDDAYWDDPRMTAGGPLVVAVTGRDQLVVMRLADRDLVDELRGKLDAARTDPEVLSHWLYLRRNGRWEVLP